ncbi:hypothetical protein EPA93_16425 [Ktedonosporobacter rubrisoli]|uniref:Uncharacterized protein n=1 Tax=Ktedonosporobacter rubrisoli TaxID=2509675 RepID=A0A4P6JQN8_KTERU|nr:hypothetical protein [Ktedonosporobacter rubrisoli]QBD77490.1 hypothetical protein EPA93_16425 [Ktedonosporobacter rubrisoli]
MRLKVARARLRTIVERAAADAMYKKQLQDRPVELLIKEGLPYDVIEDFLREVGWQAEVTGYLQPECANTCALTKIETYPTLFLSFDHSQ